MFPKLGLLGTASVLHVSTHIPECSPDLIRKDESWRQITTKMSLLSVTKPVYVIAKEVVEGWPARKK